MVFRKGKGLRRRGESRTENIVAEKRRDAVKESIAAKRGVTFSTREADDDTGEGFSVIRKGTSSASATEPTKSRRRAKAKSSTPQKSLVKRRAKASRMRETKSNDKDNNTADKKMAQSSSKPMRSILKHSELLFPSPSETTTTNASASNIPHNMIDVSCLRGSSPLKERPNIDGTMPLRSRSTSLSRSRSPNLRRRLPSYDAAAADNDGNHGDTDELVLTSGKSITLSEFEEIKKLLLATNKNKNLSRNGSLKSVNNNDGVGGRVHSRRGRSVGATPKVVVDDYTTIQDLENRLAFATGSPRSESLRGRRTAEATSHCTHCACGTRMARSVPPCLSYDQQQQPQPQSSTQPPSATECSGNCYRRTEQPNGKYYEPHTTTTTTTTSNSTSMQQIRSRSRSWSKRRNRSTPHENVIAATDAAAETRPRAPPSATSLPSRPRSVNTSTLAPTATATAATATAKTKAGVTRQVSVDSIFSCETQVASNKHRTRKQKRFHRNRVVVEEEDRELNDALEGMEHALAQSITQKFRKACNIQASEATDDGDEEEEEELYEIVEEAPDPVIGVSDWGESSGNVDYEYNPPHLQEQQYSSTGAGMETLTVLGKVQKGDCPSTTPTEETEVSHSSHHNHHRRGAAPPPPPPHVRQQTPPNRRQRNPSRPASPPTKRSTKIQMDKVVVASSQILCEGDW